MQYGWCAILSMSANFDNKQWLSALLKISQETTVRSLDANGGRPDCSQGGVAVVAFTQNQRDEVRDFGDIAGGYQTADLRTSGSMIGRSDRNKP